MVDRQAGGVSSGWDVGAGGDRDPAAGNTGSGSVPDPELVERPTRRRFTAEYKLRILGEIDACTGRGQVGALLRREGLYSSLVTDWRRARQAGSLEALGRPRGRPPASPLEAENARLRHEVERARADLAKAHRVIEVQGNVSALLEELLDPKGAKQSIER